MRDKSSWTTMMLAAKWGHANCVELLADREAKLQSKKGKTAMMIAAKHGYVDIVRFLLEKEAMMADK